MLIKGGHFSSDSTIIDLIYDGKTFIELKAPRLPVENPHGVGCTFASAIAAELAKDKLPVAAVKVAHRYLHMALKASLDWQVGRGRSPVCHAISLED